MSDLEDKVAGACKPSSADELKIALDNRTFEIQLFWQRSNYFLVLMSALGIGAFSVKDTIFAPIVSFLAALSSYFWFRVNLGSKFWQESWEVEVSTLAKEQGIRSFERSMPDVVAQVSRSLAHGQTVERRSLLRRWIDAETTRKFSVTYHMILLSLSACVVWSIVCFIFLWKVSYPVVDRSFGGNAQTPSRRPALQFQTTTRVVPVTKH